MKIILYLAAAYLAFLVILTVFQRKLIYFPYKLAKEYEFPPYVSQLEEVFITCDVQCCLLIIMDMVKVRGILLKTIFTLTARPLLLGLQKKKTGIRKRLCFSENHWEVE